MKSKTTKVSFSNTKVGFAHYSNSKLKKAYKVYQLIGNTFVTNIGATLTKIALLVRFPIKPFVKPIIFDQFCGGENLKECMPTINLLEQRKVDVSLNYGVEIKDSEKEFDITLCKTKGAIEFAGRKSNVKVVNCKVSGIGYFYILEKKQQKKSLNKKEQKQFDRMVKRMEEICEYAVTHDVFIYWDAEESWVQAEIDALVEGFMKEHNKEKAIIFNTIQLYRADKLDYLKQCIADSKKNGYVLGVKLVRGAYMEKEKDWAEENDEEYLIHSSKENVDIDFDEALELCIKNLAHVSVCVATHNEQSNLLTTELMEKYKIPANHPNVYFSQLYGMGDFITFNLTENGYNAAKYLPYGPVREVIPYLIRRAQENSSVDGQMSRELSMLKKEMDRRGV